jgi:DNA (cytosine-5)-methyltransferase 1
LDLFAGAGGLSLGFEQAGFDVLAAVEYDAVHCATHHYNFPYSHTICADLARLDAAALAEDIGTDEIDVICGGPPCQGFSLIGKRDADDPRNTLPLDFLRMVAHFRPRYFVMENVPGLAVGKQASVLHALMERFADLGYNVCEPVRILRATDFGVPQARKRLFVIGARIDCPQAAYPTPDHLAEIGAPLLAGFRRCPTVAEALDDLPDADGFPELLESDSVHAPPRQSPSAYAKRLRDPAIDPRDFSYERSHYDPALMTASLRTKHTQASADRFRATPGGETEPISRFFRLPPDGYCNTLRAGTGSARGAFTSPRPIHHIHPRCLTNREAARLHSFPDWFRFHVTKWHGFRQIGNSVPPLLARAVASSIVAAMRLHPVKPGRPLPVSDQRLLRMNMTEACQYFEVERTISGRKRGR